MLIKFTISNLGISSAGAIYINPRLVEYVRPYPTDEKTCFIGMGSHSWRVEGSLKEVVHLINVATQGALNYDK